MAALPECDAYGYIYDTSGGPAAGVLVTLKHVDDVANNPILLEPEIAYTDAQGAYHFTLPQLATAYISARATTLWDCNGGIPFKVPAAATGELAPILVPPPEAAAFTVQPPLHYASNVLSISKATAASDGYLTKEDWIRFDEGGTNLANYVPLSGGTMTGFLTLSGNPLSTFHAATKNYVDQQILAIPPPALIPIFDTTHPGLVPQPTAGDALHFLRGDATWAAVAAGVNTAANYDWTGLHTFGAITRFDSIHTLTPGVVLEIANTSASGMRLWAVSTSNSLTLDSTLLEFRHLTGIAFRLTGAPTSGAMLRFNSSDASFNLRQRYTMFASGRHYYNAPGFPSPTDNSDATVTIFANDGLSTSFAYALRCNGNLTVSQGGALVLGYQVPLYTTASNGYATPTVYDDGTYVRMGPWLHSSGTPAGLYVLHLCGTGSAEGSPGSVNQHGPLATWYYSAHIQMGPGYALTLAQAPTAPLHAATKAYVDSAVAGSSVNLAANYAWTGLHSWTKEGTFITPTNGGGVTIKAGAAGLSPNLTYTAEEGTAIVNLGVNRSAGGYTSSSAVNDFCLLNVYGNLLFRLEQPASAYRFVIGTYSSFIVPFQATAAGVLLGPRIGINTPIDSRTRVQVATYYPDWSFSFTNGVNASVNFACEPSTVGGFNPVQGRSAMIVYGDFAFRSYVDGWNGDDYWLYLGKSASGPPIILINDGTGTLAQIKFGAPGTGPGGVGRMIYTD